MTYKLFLTCAVLALLVTACTPQDMIGVVEQGKPSPESAAIPIQDSTPKIILPPKSTTGVTPVKPAVESTPQPAEPQAAGCNPVLTLTKTENQKDVIVKKGEIIAVQLETNPTTGYDWGEPQVSPGLVNETGRDYQSKQKADPSRPPIAGAPSIVTICLKAVETGKATVSFGYQRSWEKGVEPIEKFEFLLEVKE